MGAMPGLTIEFSGSEYRCSASLNVIMQIEDKVVLSDIASRIQNAAVNGSGIPSSHIAWIVYCLLRGAGALVTSEQVWKAVTAGDIGDSTIIDVCRFIIAEVYGVGPENEDGIDTDTDEKK